MVASGDIQNLHQDTSKVDIINGFLQHWTDSAFHITHECMLIGIGRYPASSTDDINHRRKVIVHYRQQHARDDKLVVF